MPNQEKSSRGVGWLLPAATLLVGLLLGGLFVALTGVGSGEEASSGGTSETTTASTSASSSSSSSDVTITVPGECLELTEDSQRLIDLVDQAAKAARDLDASALSKLVSQLQEAQSSLRTQTQACRTAAGVSS